MCLRHPEFISDPTLIILQKSVDNEVGKLKNTAKSLGSQISLVSLTDNMRPQASHGCII